MSDEIKYWTEKQIAKAYQEEHPDWATDQCEQQAKIIYKELNRSRIAIYRNNKKYNKHNVSLEDSWKRGYPSWEDILYDTPVDELTEIEDENEL